MENLLNETDNLHSIDNSNINIDSVEIIPNTEKTEVKRRGRPKGSKKIKDIENETILQPQKQPNGQTTISGKIDLSEYKTETNIVENANQSLVQSQNYFTGALLLILIDAIFPALLSFGIKKMKPNTKCKTEDFQMTKSERESIEKLADAVVLQYIGSLAPEQSFLFSIAIIYLGKSIPYIID